MVCKAFAGTTIIGNCVIHLHNAANEYYINHAVDVKAKDKMSSVRMQLKFQVDS